MKDHPIEKCTMNCFDEKRAYKVTKVFYAWIGVGDISVYVADIKEDADEKAIMDQIYAMGMGWA